MINSHIYIYIYIYIYVIEYEIIKHDTVMYYYNNLLKNILFK